MDNYLRRNLRPVTFDRTVGIARTGNVGIYRHGRRIHSAGDWYDHYISGKLVNGVFAYSPSIPQIYDYILRKQTHRLAYRFPCSLVRGPPNPAGFQMPHDIILYFRYLHNHRTYTHGVYHIRLARKLQ